MASRNSRHISSSPSLSLHGGSRNQRSRRWEEEEEEFITSGNWRGKHNSLSRGAGPSPRVQLQYFPNPAGRRTACPVEAVKSCTRRRRTPQHSHRHEHAAPCGSLHAALCMRLFASGAPSVRYTTAIAKVVETMTKTTAATPLTACPSASCAQGEVHLPCARYALAVALAVRSFALALRSLLRWPCARFCAGCALVLRSPCARLAFALRSLLRWPCARFARAYVKHLPRLIMPAPCLPSATSAFQQDAPRRVMGRLPSSAASRCAGRATSRDGETWLILRLPALKCFPSSRMDLRTGCYFLLVLTCIVAGYIFAVSFPR